VLLNKKFKTEVLPVGLSSKIESFDIEQLRKIRDNIFEISSLKDVEKYVN